MTTPKDQTPTPAPLSANSVEIDSPPVPNPFSVKKSTQTMVTELTALVLELHEKIAVQQASPPRPAVVHPHDVHLTLSYELADQDGVLADHRIHIPFSRLKAVHNLGMASATVQQAVTTLFTAPLFGELTALIAQWARPHEDGRPLALQGGTSADNQERADLEQAMGEQA